MMKINHKLCNFEEDFVAILHLLCCITLEKNKTKKFFGTLKSINLEFKTYV